MKISRFFDALNNSRLVVTDEHLMAVWWGGTTFSVYARSPDGPESYVSEVESFELSDERGMPVSREDAKVHAREWLARAHAEDKEMWG